MSDIQLDKPPPALIGVPQGKGSEFQNCRYKSHNTSIQSRSLACSQFQKIVLGFPKAAAIRNQATQP